MTETELKYAEHIFIYDNFDKTLRHCLEFWDVYDNHLVQAKVEAEGDETLGAAIQLIKDYIKDKPKETRQRYWDLKDLMVPLSVSSEYNSYFPDSKYTFDIRAEVEGEFEMLNGTYRYCLDATGIKSIR